MKATVETMTAATVQERSWTGILSDLLKARLTSLVLLTTLVGFYMGQRGGMHWLLMMHTLLATGLVAGGAAALNQYLERRHDARMPRTRGRPLPAGQLQPDTVLLIGGLMSAVGLVYLAWGVNLLTSLLGALTLGSYLFVYTPLKRITSLNTIVGAVPGALPPLMGWTAARGEVSVGGWALFAILFFWQLPHFLAIAWIYREEYGRAGFVMLPNVDPDGRRTGQQTLSHTLGLVPISLCPFIFQLAGPVYLIGALILSLGFLHMAFRFYRNLNVSNARRLFLASILYLPLLLGLMVFDKIKF